MGFEYKEILSILKERHTISLSVSGLKRHLKILGLKRRNSELTEEELKGQIRLILDGPGSLGGYRFVWHRLKMQGTIVPRRAVEKVLREIDATGVQQRRAHRLRRRTYQNEGANSVWHCDGYDKLKPYGFAIHGCIDGWSRRILWLFVTRSNNFPSNIAAYYLEAVEEIGGCPAKLVTDLGTENGLLAGIQSFFRNDSESHQYVPSPRNQRIEGWWSFLRKSYSGWWINFFKDLAECGSLDLTDPLDKECLWSSFSSLLQSELDNIKLQWNSHYIRRSHFDTIHGRPEYLFHVPESRGSRSCLFPVQESEREYARTHLVEPDYNDDYTEYLDYVSKCCNIPEPKNWREALNIFQTLLSIAKPVEI